MADNKPKVGSKALDVVSRLRPSTAKSAAPIKVTVDGIEGARKPVTAGRVLEWYVRLMALVFFAAGILQWAILIGLISWNDLFVLDLSRPLQAALVYFAVIDLVAAVGLWLAAPWGGVVWLLSAMSRIMLHTFFMGTFGRENALVIFHIVTVVIYLTLTFFAQREELKNR